MTSEWFQTSFEHVSYPFLCFCHDAISVDSPKIEGIEGNRHPRDGEIRRNPATIALAKFIAHVIPCSVV